MMGPIDPPYMAHGDGGGVTWANEDSIRSREDIAFWKGHAAGLAARPDGSILKPMAVWICLAGLILFAYCIWHDHTTLVHTIKSLWIDLTYILDIAWGKL
jgi:hypothetical protein